jgi:hypothetical protein
MPDTPTNIATAQAETPPPLIVSSDLNLPTLITLARNIGILIGGAVTVMGFLSKHDAAGLTAWLQGSDIGTIVTAGGAVLAAGGTLYGAYKAHRNKAALVTAAAAAPNSVAIVK